MGAIGKAISDSDRTGEGASKKGSNGDRAYRGKTIAEDIAIAIEVAIKIEKAIAKVGKILKGNATSEGASNNGSNSDRAYRGKQRAAGALTRRRR